MYIEEAADSFSSSLQVRRNSSFRLRCCNIFMEILQMTNHVHQSETFKNKHSFFFYIVPQI